MRTLIVYATNSGSTYVAGTIVKEILSQKHEVTMKKAVEITLNEFGQYDLIVVGSPSWDFTDEEGRKEGQPHQSIMALMNTLRTHDYSHKKFAIFGCGDSSYTFFCGAVDHMETFVKDVKGQKIGDSLRIDGFFFDEDNNSKKTADWATQLLSISLI